MHAQTRVRTAKALRDFRSPQPSAIEIDDGAWREKTQWHACVCYGAAADYSGKIQTGAHVFIEGELAHREYERTIETDSGPVKVPWPVTEIVADSVSVLDRKEKQERRGAA